MIARLKLVEPCNENRQVDTAEVVSIAPAHDDRALIGARAMPTRQPNADLRSREYLAPAEIERLIKAAKDGRWGQRDASLVIVAYRHGLRAKEACELEWSKSSSAARLPCMSAAPRRASPPSTRSAAMNCVSDGAAEGISRQRLRLHHRAWHAVHAGRHQPAGQDHRQAGRHSISRPLPHAAP